MRESLSEASQKGLLLKHIHNAFPFFLFLGFVYYYSPFSIPFYQTQNLLRSSEKCQDGPAAAIAVGQNLASFQDMSDFHTKICIVLVVCK